jgi:hypothetical protein
VVVTVTFQGSIGQALGRKLLLFQELAGGRTDKMDRKLLPTVFADVYYNGEVTYEHIEEGLGWGGTRAQLVHPGVAGEAGWTPSFFADDYYVYDFLLRALLTYLVTGDTFEDYPLHS